MRDPSAGEHGKCALCIPRALHPIAWTLQHGGRKLPAGEASDYFTVPIVEAPAPGGQRDGLVLVPLPELGKLPVGLTEAFLEDAATYHERFTSGKYYKWLISEALQRIGTLPPRPIVLDLGSGSGNSVLPCLELLPDCRIVAVDLSPALLRILQQVLADIPWAACRVLPVCMNACQDYYREGVFDVVIGAAILHHLIDPATAFCAAARALKPGGCAMFFEPFESGHSILRIAYTQILEKAEREPQRHLSPEIHRLLKALVDDFSARTGTDKSKDIF